MADSGPPRPRRPPRAGFGAPDFFCESSGARLGPSFRPCWGGCPLLRAFEGPLKELIGEDFLGTFW